MELHSKWCNYYYNATDNETITAPTNFSANYVTTTSPITTATTDITTSANVTGYLATTTTTTTTTVFPCTKCTPMYNMQPLFCIAL